ncbi:glycosyltransferase family 2 protein [Shewanella subflava]|uniref:Glycosyltransferase n=1 Tax=Shewanella subflava TaxID=2986476 RepID=A0ABT3IBQ9_9GAMM|nr:glycosyltransferase family 2 protein [Shewanella subflava]MCW3173489.1 glycosyltransferase [Shewanella subflava]
MPAYNSEDTILDSIKSVCEQTYVNWELIVVDDKSSDKTLEVVSNFKDSRIKTISFSKNTGSPAIPRNIGIEQSKGEYLAFLDSDDIWYSKKLEIQIEFMVSSGSLFSCTGYDIANSDLVPISSYTPPAKVSYRQLLLNNSVGCLTAVVHRRLVADMRFPVCGHEDFSFWLKLIKESKSVEGLPQKLACYRLMKGSVSSNKKKLVGYFWNIYRNEEALSRTVSLYYCIRYLINVLWFKYK